MQRQRRAERRSWGELLAGWLLVLWGSFPAWVGCVLDGDEGTHWWPRAVLLHGLFCLLSGLAVLFRLRSVSAWFLRLAAFGSLAMAFFWIVSEPEHHFPRWRLELDLIALAFAAASVLIAICFFFVARWLGRQEDNQD